MSFSRPLIGAAALVALPLALALGAPAANALSLSGTGPGHATASTRSVVADTSSDSSTDRTVPGVGEGSTSRCNYSSGEHCIVPKTPPTGTVGTPYSFLVETQNLEATPRFGVLSTMPLPPGLTIDATTGLISGTPTRAGTYYAAVTVSDVDPAKVDTATLKIEIAADPTAIKVGCPTTVIGRVGATVNEKCTVYSGGEGTWSVAYGSFPEGLTLDPKTGAITGSPTRPGPSQAGLRFSTEHGSATVPVNFSIAASVAGRY